MNREFNAIKHLRLLCLLLSLASTPSLAEPPRVDRALDVSVERLAALLSDGIATLDRGRRVPVRSGNLTAVMFNLQGPGGGNGTWQFLAFFETNAHLPEATTPSGYRLLGFAKIGSAGDRFFDPATAVLRRRQLRIDGAAFARGDAACCPSRPIRSLFVLGDGNVVEQRIAR